MASNESVEIAKEIERRHREIEVLDPNQRPTISDPEPDTESSYLDDQQPSAGDLFNLSAFGNEEPEELDGDRE